MSSNPPSCWSQCLWCLCTCNGRRISSVGPSEPFPVVSVNGRKDQNLSGTRTIQVEPTKSEQIQYGVVNQFFVLDENNEAISAAGESGIDHPQQAPIIISTDADSSSDHHLQHSIFIEIDKDRRIRVVHLQPKLKPGEESSSSCEAPQVVHLSPTTHERSSTIRKSVPGDEEDEYWFSKWTRKPRFRSIFQSNNTAHTNADDAGGGEEGGENNNACSNNGGGAVSRDFEIARAAAAAKRRAWAYNNRSSEPVVQQSTVVDNSEEEEYNSISICESSTKWSKSGNNKSERGDDSGNKTPPNTPRSRNNSTGSTNFGFVEDDVQMEKDVEVIHEMAVDCPPDFVSPVKSLSLKRGGPSPSPSSSSTIVMGKSQSGKEGAMIPDEVQQTEIQSGLNVKKPPILFFIHGISESSEVWKAQIDFFHNVGYEIVAPDLLGHGYSSTPNVAKYYHFETIAQDLLGVFDYFVEAERKVVIIGHGYGASLAAVISRVRPKSCSVLVSISGGGPTPLVNRSCCRGSLVPFYCKIFHKNTNSGRFDNPDLRHVLPTQIHKHVINGQMWSDGDSAFYRRISVPTLLVFGMKDKIVNLVEICEMERTIPKSFLEVIDSAGHLVQIEEPVKLNKMVAKFIQSWI